MYYVRDRTEFHTKILKKREKEAHFIYNTHAYLNVLQEDSKNYTRVCVHIMILGTLNATCFTTAYFIEIFFSVICRFFAL